MKFLINVVMTRYAINTNKLLFVFCLLIPLQATAIEPGIEVSGQGNVIVEPDVFSLTLTITERGRVPDKLKVLVDKKSNAVVDAAKHLNVKEMNISSARVNLRVIKEKQSIQLQGVEINKAKHGSVFIDGQNINKQSQQHKQGQQKPVLFELSRYITVNFNSIEQYDSFLSKIIKLNVTHISSLTMNVAEREEYYQQALLKAISQATQKAIRMAKQSGLTLGNIQSIQEQSRNNYRPMYAEAMMTSRADNSHSSLAGNQTISARVLIKFDLRN